MEKLKSIKLNFLMNTLLTMSSFVFPLITFPYVSRVLHPTGTGEVAFVTSIVSYFSIFAQLGIPTYGIRICARVRRDKAVLTRTVHELLFINFITCMIAYAAMAVSILFIKQFDESKELLIVISSSVFLNMIGVEWLYKGLELYRYITIRSLAFKVISLFIMFLLVRDSEDVVLYGMVSIFASSASNILNFFNIRKYILKEQVGKYNLVQHLKPVCVFFAMACATTVYTNLDTIMLGFMTSNEEVGFYNAAIKIKIVLVSVVTSLGTVLLPRVSYYVQNKLYKEFNDIKEKALNFVVVLSVPLTVYFFIYAKWVMILLAGQEYVLAVRPMQIIILTLPLIGISSLLGYEILVPFGREVVFLYSLLGGAVTDMVLNVIFIPRAGASGAAFATLIAEAVVLLILIISLGNSIIGAFKKIQIYKVIVGIIASTAVSEILSLNVGNVNFKVFITGISFFCTYIIMLIIMREKIVSFVIGLKK